MLFATWSRSASQPTRQRRDRAEGSAASTIATQRGELTVVSPFRLERRREEGVGWLYPGAATEDQAEARGPDARLSNDRLRVTAGPLPQLPLYYYDSGRVFAVSSELELLVEAFPSPINRRRVVGLAAGLFDPFPGDTVFSQHRRLLGGETITVGPEGVAHDFHIPKAGSTYLTGSVDGLASALRSHLRDAVRRAIGDARRVAVFAGGGLDSSGMLALALAACREDKRDLDAIAEVWASPGDDRPYLAALEQALGITAHRLPASEAGSWFVASLCSDAQPQLFGAACLDMHLWAASRERKADVALAGHAGDEISGGIVSFASLVRRGKPLEAISAALRLQVPKTVSGRARMTHWVVGPLIRPHVPRLLRTRVLRWKRRADWMTVRFLRELDECLEPTPVSLPETPDQWMAYWCGSALFSELAVSWGQVASVTGAAAVDVFRDPELVRFICQIDPLLLSADHLSRGLFRRAMTGLIPESIRLRTDKALGQPGVAAAAISAGALDHLRELGTLSALADLGLVEPRAFRPTFEAWLVAMQRGERTESDPTDESWHRVWQLLSVETFLRRHHG